MPLVNGSIAAKRGVYAAFRKHLNEQCADYQKWRNKGDVLREQRTRGYGDYLYHQDRAMFDEALWRALQGRDFPDFDWKRWLGEGDGKALSKQNSDTENLDPEHVHTP